MKSPHRSLSTKTWPVQYGNDSFAAGRERIFLPAVQTFVAIKNGSVVVHRYVGYGYAKLGVGCQHSGISHGIEPLPFDS